MYANHAFLECLVRDRLAEARADAARHRLARQALARPPRRSLGEKIGDWMDRAVVSRFPGGRAGEAGASLRGA